MLIRRFLAALLLIVGLASASYALSPGAALVLNSSCANGASVTIDFTTGQTCGPATLTTVRSNPSLAYAQRLDGTWVGFPPHTARITDQGLLAEEARTNSIRNNSMQGAVAGTPGTNPTNWGVSINGALTKTIVGTGVVNGIDYIDIRVQGTPSATSVNAIQFDGSNAIAALQGQVWTGSVFVALVAGNLTNVTGTGVGFAESDSGGSSLTTGVGTSYTPTSTLTRQTYTRTLSNALTAFYVVNFRWGYTDTVTPVDFTFRIGWPQLELGSFATSPIRTTNVAVVRSFDNITLTNPPTIGTSISMFYQSDATPLNAGSTQSWGSFSDGTTNNSVWAYVATSTTTIIPLRVLNANVGVDVSGKAGTANSPLKGAFTFTNGDGAATVNGLTVSTGTQTFPTGLNTIHIGSAANTRFLNTYIKKEMFWVNTRLPNATLQRLTAP